MCLCSHLSVYPGYATVFSPTLSVTGRHPTLLRDRSFSDCLDTKMAFLNNQVISIFNQQPGILTPPPPFFLHQLQSTVMRARISGACFKYGSLHLKPQSLITAGLL